MDLFALILAVFCLYYSNNSLLAIYVVCGIFYEMGLSYDSVIAYDSVAGHQCGVTVSSIAGAFVL